MIADTATRRWHFPRGAFMLFSHFASLRSEGFGDLPEPMRGIPELEILSNSRGDLWNDLPFDFFEISPTKRKTATACAIAVLICNIKPAVPCEREDRNPALARWCPLFCFVLPTSSKPVKGAVVREVCIPQNEVRAPSICCGSTKSPITNTAG